MTRSHQHVLEIFAPPADVWNAITAAEELVRWFPLAASTVPGEGGEIVYRWGELVGRCRILAWDPPRHLATSWMEALGGASPAATPLAVDWFLEGQGGRTTLRLVHSGFGPGARWEKEFDGTQRGWTFELQALKHYLEHQRGRERRATWARRAVDCAPAEVWRRFTSPGPVFARIDLAALGPGDAYRFERADGEELHGRVLVNHAPFEFAGTFESHGGGMLRFGFEDCMGRPEAHLWLAAWGRSAEEFARLEQGWRRVLERAFA
jgi:uncharacterized protein YndB with AHSA1/START domain